MGSLTSRPKIPAIQQSAIFTVPSTVSLASVSPAAYVPQSSGNTIAEIDSSNEDAAQIISRESNLLSRRRGRIGTVLTGFRGVLNKEASQPRKTLLGE